MMTLRRAAALPLIALVHLYRGLISPLLGPSCRFQPTCSDYALQALRLHGPVRGTVLAVRRILRCNPFTRLEGGWAFDPVPGSHGPDTCHGDTPCEGGREKTLP